MAVIVWNEKYSVGVREFDAQHQQLINILNDLYDAMQAHKADDVLGQILSQLINYTKIHFTNEEKYMEKYAYPDLPAQKREHEAFVKKMMDFKESFDSGKTIFSVSLTSFLKDWLFNHIGGIDKKYTSFFNSKGVN